MKKLLRWAKWLGNMGMLIATLFITTICAILTLCLKGLATTFEAGFTVAGILTGWMAGGCISFANNASEAITPTYSPDPSPFLSSQEQSHETQLHITESHLMLSP